MIDKIHGKLKIRHLYTCARCGHRQQGSSSHEVHVNASSAEELAVFVAALRPSPHTMPMVWSSHYSEGGTIFYCPRCP
jgi:predicted RNA-binding Zn-ribbon protein involved in translation (DUF1610 family)